MDRVAGRTGGVDRGKRLGTQGGERDDERRDETGGKGREVDVEEEDDGGGGGGEGGGGGGGGVRVRRVSTGEGWEIWGWHEPTTEKCSQSVGTWTNLE